jgi:hypothetical protein
VIWAEEVEGQMTIKRQMTNVECRMEERRGLLSFDIRHSTFNIVRPLLLLPVALAGLALLSAGCHPPHQCSVMQRLGGGKVTAPLPPAGDSYKVIGYRKGIRFYVVQYNDRLYRGGDLLSREGFQSLRELGILTIVAVTPSDEERKLAGEFRMKYVEIPFGAVALTGVELERFLAAADAGPAPLYVHCFGGDLRAGILLAHYRIHREGWTYKRAIDEYYRLDAKRWDADILDKVLQENATAKSGPPSHRGRHDDESEDK